MRDLERIRGKLPVPIPILEKKNMFDMYQLSMGTYRVQRAHLYVAMARRLELEARRNTFDNEVDFQRACRNRPQDLRVYYRAHRDRPWDWDDQEYGLFPPEGVLLLFTTFPSAHFSTTQRRFDKHCLLVLSKTPNPLLQYRGVLKTIHGFKCSNKVIELSLFSILFSMLFHTIYFFFSIGKL